MAPDLHQTGQEAVSCGQPASGLLCHDAPRCDVWISTEFLDVEFCLDGSEAAVMARFALDRDRQRYARAHSLKRRILAESYVHAAPGRLRFERLPQGKPRLIDVPLEFSLSHSEEAFALAVSSDPVGVDIQLKDDVADLDRVADVAFHPAEVDYWRRNGRTLDVFYRLWTGKEAMLKAEGTGFLSEARTFDGSAQESQGFVAGPTGNWKLFFAERGRFTACVAVPADRNIVPHWLDIEPDSSANQPQGLGLPGVEAC